MLGRRQPGFIIGEEPLTEGPDPAERASAMNPGDAPAARENADPSWADVDRAANCATPPTTPEFRRRPTAARGRAAVPIALLSAGLLLAVLLARAIVQDGGPRPMTARERPASAEDGHVDHARGRVRTGGRIEGRRPRARPAGATGRFS